MSIKNMGKRDEVTNNTEGVRVGLIAMEFERIRVISIGDRTFSLPLTSYLHIKLPVIISIVIISHGHY